MKKIENNSKNILRNLNILVFLKLSSRKKLHLLRGLGRSKKKRKGWRRKIRRS